MRSTKRTSAWLGAIRVPGFRPGKAPRAVLERAIGPEIVLSEAADICMNDAYAQAIKEHDLHPLGYPDVESPKSRRDRGGEAAQLHRQGLCAAPCPARRLSCAAHRAAGAGCDPGGCGSGAAELQEEQAPWEPVEDGPAESGDLATLRLIATVDDETLVDQESWEYRLNDRGVAQPADPRPLGADHRHDHAARARMSRSICARTTRPPSTPGKQMAMHIELLRLERQGDARSWTMQFARDLGRLRVARSGARGAARDHAGAGNAPGGDGRLTRGRGAAGGRAGLDRGGAATARSTRRSMR